MKTVYIAESALDAQIIHDQLVQSGIQAFIAGVSLSSAIGELPANLGPEVKVVNNQDYLKARALIELIDAEQKQESTNLDLKQVACVDCGESIEIGFNQCWKCGRIVE